MLVKVTVLPPSEFPALTFFDPARERERVKRATCIKITVLNTTVCIRCVPTGDDVRLCKTVYT